MSLRKEELHYSKFIVNKRNPRFKPVRTEGEAVKVMMNRVSKQVRNLAKDIAQYGLNPSKRLMVTEIQDKGYLSLEGNRRLIATRLLNEPEAAPTEKDRAYFKKLKQEFGERIPTTIECVIFPDKQSSDRWVNLEHTGRNNGVGTLTWNSEQSKRFASQQSGAKKSKVLLILDLADALKIDRENVDTTTLDRLISTPSVREKIGFSFLDGTLEITKNEAEVKRNLSRVLRGMANKDFKVTDVYTVSKMNDWVDGVLETRKYKKKNELSHQGKVRLPAAVRQLEKKAPEYKLADKLEIVKTICLRFFHVVQALQDRHDGRPAMKIENEYDAQDLMRAMLKIFIDDVRKEQYVQEFAAASTRVDFLIIEDETFLELKYVHKKHSDKEIADQILLDMARYPADTRCKRIVFFIFDPGQLLKNPVGLQKDLSTKSSPNLQMDIIISPQIR